MTSAAAANSALVPANRADLRPKGHPAAAPIGLLEGRTPVLTERGWVPIARYDCEVLPVWTGTGFAPMRVVPQRRADAWPWEVVALRLSDGSDLRCAPTQLLPLYEVGTQGTVVRVRKATHDDRLHRGGWPMLE